MSLHQQPPYDTYIHNSNYSTALTTSTDNNTGNYSNNISYYNTNNSSNNKGYDHNINTLFVAELPDNVKAREIHNLFHSRPGFDYCQLKYTGRGNQVVAFAIFVNHQSAIAALHAMNGVLFDPQSGHTLKIELARSNSTRIRKPGGGSYVVIDNRDKTEQHKKAPTTDDGNSESDEDNRTHETDGDESDSATAKRFPSFVVAFAIFVNHQSAIAALHAMNGVLFDPQSGHTLKIELARSNSTRIRKPGGGSYVVIDNRDKTEQHKKAPTTDDGNSESDEDNRTHETDGDESDSATAKSVKEDADHETTGEAEITEKAANGGCSTLFIANLGPNCTEPELEQVVSQYSGFKVLQVRARGAMPVAFADFEDAEQATTAMDALQGYSLPSSDRGGMHIEYARSKEGREVN